MSSEALPSLDFSTFVLGIIGSAYVHLGDAPPPEGIVADLELARQDIDLLELLQQKTKNNLTGEEEGLMAQALSDLKARYIEVERSGLAR